MDLTNSENTDEFIQRVGFEVALDDPSWSSYSQFGPGGAASRYVIINGVANSPSHKQWEVLFNETYFPPGEVGLLRALIDKVTVKTAEPRPPVLRGVRRIEGGAVEFEMEGELGRNYHIEFSADLKSWKRVAVVSGGQQRVIHRDAGAASALVGFYRAVGE